MTITKINEKKALSAAQLNRLQPFLVRKGARQKVILYLFALGYQPGELCVMKVNELKSITMPADIALWREQILESHTKGLVFVYENSGKPLLHTAYYHLISQVSNKILGKTLTYKQFRAFINTGKQ